MRTWRNRPWVNFELYDELVGNSRATGRLVIRMDGQDDGTGQQTGDMDELEVIHEVEVGPLYTPTKEELILGPTGPRERCQRVSSFQ